MNNKAFTLVELVSIIVVLSAIFLVTFPNLVNQSKKIDDAKNVEQTKEICLAGENLIYSNMGDYPNLKIVGETIEINLEQLYSYNLLKINDLRGIVRYTVLEDYSLDCEYIEE